MSRRMAGGTTIIEVVRPATIGVQRFEALMCAGVLETLEACEAYRALGCGSSAVSFTVFLLSQGFAAR